MVSCAVPGCNSSHTENPQNVTFHIFPQDIGVKQKWLKTINRDDWAPKKYSKVCSKHFEQNCFSQRTAQRVKLRCGSVPTLFMPHTVGSGSGVGTSADELKPRGRLLVAQHKISQHSQKHSPDAAASSSRVEADAALYEDASLYEDADSAAGGGAPPDAGNVIERQCCECRRQISGFRYTCVQCADCDLCAACEASGAHALHYVLRVPADRPYDEVESVLQRLRHALPVGGGGAGAGDAPFADDVKVEVKQEAEDLGPDPLQPGAALVEYFEPSMQANGDVLKEEINTDEIDIDDIKLESEGDSNAGEIETVAYSGYVVHSAGITKNAGEVTTAAARKRKAECSEPQKRLLIEIDAGSINCRAGGAALPLKIFKQDRASLLRRDFLKTSTSLSKTIHTYKRNGQKARTKMKQ